MFRLKVYGGRLATSIYVLPTVGFDTKDKEINFAWGWWALAIGLKQ